MIGFKKNWKRILLVLVALVLVGFFIGFPFLIARLVTRAGTRPQDRALTSSPADYDLDFEDVTFSATDGVELSGWYLGGGDKKLSVAVGHGLFRSRREVLDRAAFFRSQGLDTLLFDFRRHGDSGGERTSLGYHERLDFMGAARFLREREPQNPVLFYGVSMGAAAALLAARDDPDVAAVIADSPFLSLEHTVVHHTSLIFGLPRFPFASALLFFLERQADFSREDFDLERAVEQVGDRPVLIMAGERDQRMPVEVQMRLYEASRSQLSGFESFAEAGHGAAYKTEPRGYEHAIRSFLTNAGLLSDAE